MKILEKRKKIPFPSESSSENVPLSVSIISMYQISITSSDIKELIILLHITLNRTKNKMWLLYLLVTEGPESTLKVLTQSL